ncbi:class II fructose-bisphosphate aldolase [[Mycoplasma] collis]|uniref:class II fructose-bisphosphate aldolase n=1 Tax=[Mycoplasma] collis TaxID=2127 RepID=UPI00068A876C|nr:class II fructose-bisphosphate aldolase [[Mycoplasma] collis]
MNKKSLKLYLQELKQSKKAILAFNIINLETLNAIIKAGEETQVPLIIQITPSALKYADYELLVPAVLKAIKNAKSIFYLHLDHCSDLELLKKAVNDGFDSAMYDGSHLEFEENIYNSLQAKKIAENLTLELEIGKIGGKEENVIANDAQIVSYEKAKYFYTKTKSELLAIAFGTIHGVEKKASKLEFSVIEKIANEFSVSPVMHGTSGLDISTIKKAINSGIVKINIASDLLVEYIKAFKEYTKKYDNFYDLRKINLYAIEKVKEKIIFYINNLVLN